MVYNELIIKFYSPRDCQYHNVKYGDYKKFEDANYDTVIIDSLSHEWEGIGGCLEQAEEIEKRTGKTGLHCWAKPKAAHRRLMQRIMQTPLNIILCVRSREKFKQEGKNIVAAGYEPIQEKGFVYEMLVHFRTEGTKPIMEKCLDSLSVILKPQFEKDGHITEGTGKAIRTWIDGGVKVDLDLKKHKTNLLDACMLGGKSSFDNAWKELPAGIGAKLKADNDFMLKCQSEIGVYDSNQNDMLTIPSAQQEPVLTNSKVSINPIEDLL